jgi:hypothetical protein
LWLYADETLVSRASQYIAACVADPSCTLSKPAEGNRFIKNSASARTELLGSKGAFAVSFFLTTVVGSYLPCIFRRSNHFMVRAACFHSYLWSSRSFTFLVLLVSLRGAFQNAQLCLAIGVARSFRVFLFPKIFARLGLGLC